MTLDDALSCDDCYDIAHDVLDTRQRCSRHVEAMPAPFAVRSAMSPSFVASAVERLFYDTMHRMITERPDMMPPDAPALGVDALSGWPGRGCDQLSSPHANPARRLDESGRCHACAVRRFAIRHDPVIVRRPLGAH